MESLAAAGEEALDEAVGLRACDQLELEVADAEVAPGVVAGVTELTARVP